MRPIGVITGDIIKSRKLSKQQRDNVLLLIKKTFSAIVPHFVENKKTPRLEFFRGDSFQAIIDDPKYALRISILLRAKLRSETNSKTPRGKKLWDTRIGIGLGGLNFLGKQIISSDGEAFVLSGFALDKLKGKSVYLQIGSPDSGFNEEFELYMLLAETIIGDWTIAQSEAAFYYLLETKKTQTELTKIMNIDQSSLSRRIQSGHIDEIRLLCERFEKLIPQLTWNT